ncbi:unnamed protein product [Enterobius vermicularis]|uniref:Uncharacterized protein n=1 Tax=Enterobius vermicularis TaxID=51028 RepID=A0A0N4VM27_ENTVE|nr:unnamed protein product [Enterobius vermicularis]
MCAGLWQIGAAVGLTNCVGQLTNSQLFMGSPCMAVAAGSNSAFSSPSPTFPYNFCSTQQPSFFQGEQGLPSTSGVVYNVGTLSDSNNNNNYESVF